MLRTRETFTSWFTKDNEPRFTLKGGYHVRPRTIMSRRKSPSTEHGRKDSVGTADTRKFRFLRARSSIRVPLALPHSHPPDAITNPETADPLDAPGLAFEFNPSGVTCLGLIDHALQHSDRRFPPLLVFPTDNPAADKLHRF
jgi:hypothetical protein